MDYKVATQDVDTEVIVIKDDDDIPEPAIKQENLKRNNFKDRGMKRKVIIDTFNNTETLVVRKKLYKEKRKHEKREVKFDTANNSETLVITQKVVKKQKIECIINLTNYCELEETVCEQNSIQNSICNAKCEVSTLCEQESEIHVYKNKEKKKGGSSKSDSMLKLSKSSLVERILPYCFRQCCKSRSTSERSKQKQRKATLKKTEYSTHNSSKQTISSTSLSLSPLYPASPDISYESISNNSFSSSLYEEHNIDMLIKRTKNREKRLSMAFDPPPLRASTPQDTSYVIEVEDSNSGIDSVQSAVTLVLEPINITPATTPENLITEDNYSSTDGLLETMEIYSPIPENLIIEDKNAYSGIESVQSVVTLVLEPKDVTTETPENLITEDEKAYSPTDGLIESKNAYSPTCPTISPDPTDRPYSPTSPINYANTEAIRNKVGLVKSVNVDITPTVKSEMVEAYSPTMSPVKVELDEDLFDTKPYGNASMENGHSKTSPNNVSTGPINKQNEGYQSLNNDLKIKSEYIDDNLVSIKAENIDIEYDICNNINNAELSGTQQLVTNMYCFDNIGCTVKQEPM